MSPGRNSDPCVIDRTITRAGQRATRASVGKTAPTDNRPDPDDGHIVPMLWRARSENA